MFYTLYQGRGIADQNLQQNAYRTSFPDQFSLAPDMRFAAKSGRQYFLPALYLVAKNGRLQLQEFTQRQISAPLSLTPLRFRNCDEFP